ncbi:MAG: hypothetical protein LBU32_02780 [Clostridiales bacterium]|jgi:hypothetical protein|nr:hypothetical protein [Clostridiales bacterium]
MFCIDKVIQRMARHAPWGFTQRRLRPTLAEDLNRPSMDKISSKLCDSLSLKAGIEILFLQDLAAYPGALKSIAFKV